MNPMSDLLKFFVDKYFFYYTYFRQSKVVWREGPADGRTPKLAMGLL